MVLYSPAEGGAGDFVRLESVGRGGALLRCEAPVPVGEVVDLTICLAGGVIRARGRVLYHLQHEDGLGVGVEFLELAPAGEELLEYLVTPDPDEADSAGPDEGAYAEPDGEPPA